MGGEFRRGVDAFHRRAGLAGAEGERGADVARLGDHVAGRGGDADFVAARRQTGEADIAVGVGDRGGAGRHAAAIQQRHGHAGEAAFVALLRAVAVGVEIDMGGQAGRGVEAFHRAAGVAGMQNDWGANIGVLQNTIAGRRRYRHFVAAWHQSAKTYVSVGIADRGGAGRVAAAIEQRHRQAG